MVVKLTVALGAIVLCSVAPAEPAVLGEYVEARTCDVWTGPCFANGEMNLRGKNAVVGWIVTKGSWDGTALDGLKAVAVLNSEGTLHTDTEGKVQAALYIDASASDPQAQALQALVKALAPKHLGNIVKVARGTITWSRKDLEAVLTVGSDVSLKTTPLCSCDTICCNEEQFYPAVSDGTRVTCVKAAEHSYQGAALDGVRWSDGNRRSGMVGTFSR